VGSRGKVLGVDGREQGQVFDVRARHCGEGAS
jgi:hypothetical protein